MPARIGRARTRTGRRRFTHAGALIAALLCAALCNPPAATAGERGHGHEDTPAHALERLAREQAALRAALARHHRAALKALARRFAALHAELAAAAERDELRRALERLTEQRVPPRAGTDASFGSSLALAFLERNDALRTALQRFLARGGTWSDPATAAALHAAKPAPAPRDPVALLTQCDAHIQQALDAYGQGHPIEAARELQRAAALHRTVLTGLGFTGEGVEGTDI